MLGNRIDLFAQGVVSGHFGVFRSHRVISLARLGDWRA
jgi:hypothetical protein